MEIGLTSSSKTFDPADYAFHAAAINVQMIRDFCPAWGLEPWPIVPYRTIPATGVVPLNIVDDVGLPGADGFHDDFGGAIYAKSIDAGGDDAVVPAHESLEMRLDPQCNLWVPRGDGLEAAKEASDAVEDTSYSISVELFGETRSIRVTNFLLPNWFVLGSAPPYDFLGVLKAPFSLTPGGYTLLRDAAGNVTFDPPMSTKAAEKAAQMLSRVARRLAKAAQP